jgi:hypothetical protein
MRCPTPPFFLFERSLKYVSWHYLASGMSSFVGASMVKWTKKVLQFTKTIMILVKGLKVVAKYCLNWNFFPMMTSIVVLNTQI